MQSLSHARLSDHARLEMARRNISEDEVLQAIAAPDRIIPIRAGRVVIHKRSVAEPGQKTLLYRVFVDVDRLPPVVVTAYRTSKLHKYEPDQ